MNPSVRPPSHPAFKDYHVLIVGISTYSPSVAEHLGEIPYACRDAHTLEACFHDIGYRPENVHRLCSCHPQPTTEVTRARLHHWIRERQGMIEGARAVLVCWAGHGHVQGDDTHLLCSDANVVKRSRSVVAIENAHNGAVAMERLLDWVDQFDAGSIAIFVDACHSAAPRASLHKLRWHEIALFAGSATAQARDRVPGGDGGAFATLLPRLLKGYGSRLDARGFVSLADVLLGLDSQVGMVAPGQMPFILPRGTVRDLRGLPIGLNWPDHLHQLTSGLPGHYRHHLRAAIEKSFDDVGGRQTVSSYWGVTKG